MQYDQDIVDLLTSLKPGSVTGEGGMYAAALPPPPVEAKPEPDESRFSLRGPAADRLQVSHMVHHLFTGFMRHQANKQV